MVKMNRKRRGLKDDIRVKDNLSIRRIRPDDGGDSGSRRKGPSGAPPIAIRAESNVELRLVDPTTGEVKEKRRSHNIFVNYGRDWLASLVGLQSGGTPFRTDRPRYMAFGIGGTSQLIDADTIRGTAPGSPYSYPQYPNQWGTATPGSGNPSQTDTDPSVIGIEWPVVVLGTNDYYDDISLPNVYPGSTGVIRFTSVLGLTEVSFGAHPSVPLSEIGLFTESVTQTDPPTTAVLPAEKYMIAYNTFDTLSKTTQFVLEIDWELRFS